MGIAIKKDMIHSPYCAFFFLNGAIPAVTTPLHTTRQQACKANAEATYCVP